MTRSRFGKFQGGFSEVFWLSLFVVMVLATGWALVDRVVGRTQGSLPAFVKRVAHIGMVDHARSALVLNSSNDYHGSIVLRDQASISDAHLPVGMESHKAFLVHFTRNTGGNQGATEGRLSLEWYKPIAGVLQGIVADENTPTYNRIQGNRLSVVDVRQRGLNRFTNQTPARLNHRNNVGPIGLIELFPAQIQAISGAFCKLLSRFEHLVSLDAVISHFVELPVHSLPLKVSDSRTDNSRHRDYNSESKFIKFFVAKPLLKTIYLSALFLVAFLLGVFTMMRVVQQWCPYAFSVSLVAFLGICIHIGWVLVHLF